MFYKVQTKVPGSIQISSSGVSAELFKYYFVCGHFESVSSSKVYVDKFKSVLEVCKLRIVILVLSPGLPLVVDADHTTKLCWVFEMGWLRVLFKKKTV